MLKASALLCAILAVASAQPQSPFSFSNGPPSSSSPFGHFPGSRGPPPGGRGPPPGFPSPNFKPRQNSPSKLFSWLGNTMSKFSGGLPKLQYHNPKSKPSHGGHPGFGPSSSPQNAPPTYFSSSGGGPPRESLILPQIPNSVYEGGSSPFGGSSVSFAPNSNSIEHGPVVYRTQSGGPPPNFGSGGGPSYSSGGPSFSSGGPSFSSGGPPSYSSGGPPSFSSGRPGPNFSTGRPGSRPSSRPRPQSFSSRPPPSYSSGSSGEPQLSPFSDSSNPSYSSDSPFSSRPYPSHSQQGIRENLEVFPSQQISYQSQTVSQNEPGYDDALGGLQNLYGSQSNNKPSYQSRPNNYEQQGSYSQQQQQQVSNDGSNYGATFHTVKVAPIYDIQDHFRASPSDMSQSASNVQQQQQQQQNGNIHDTPFSTLVNEYSAQADAVTSGSEQSMMSAQLQNGDLAAAASSSPIQGVQILGQGVNAEGNPVFEVVADGNSPTYDGHPVDLNKLISMIEPGAQIDTLPQYNQDATSGSASEQHPVYVQAPTRLDMESEAAMSSAVSGNKKFVSGFTQSDKKSNIDDNNDDDELHGMASEARPTIVKPDGSRLTKGDDDKLIKEHFDKEIIFDDLQDNKDKGFIILGVSPDNETGDVLYTHTANRGTGTVINNDDLLAIVQQLRNSAANSQFSVVNKPENSNNNLAQNPDYSTVTTLPNDESKTVTSTPNIRWKTTQHPNHNYNIRNTSRIKFQDDTDRGRETPVINPIFDSVRQQRGNSDSNISSASDNETYYDNNASLVVDDEDDDQMFPDDMTIETAGDLAASASRNVKSVAIIVTPPPTYVKIKNKYKKVNDQVSTTSAPTTTSLTPPPPGLSDNIDEAFSESLSRPSNRNENSRDFSNYDNHSSITSTLSSSLRVEKDADDSGSNDSILKLISTISSNITSDSGTEDGNQKPSIRYPVYRGKSSA